MSHKWKISPYVVVLVVILLIGYGRFLWPAYSSSGDWAYPNPTRSLFFSGWLPLFNWYDLNSYSGLAFHVLIDPLIGFLNVYLRISPLLLMTIFYFWLPIALMSSGMWRLVKDLTKDHRAAFWASLVFSVNTYIITLLISGHLNGAVAYGTIPWIIWSLQRLATKPTARQAAVMCFWMALQGIYEPRYLLITIIITFAWLLITWCQHKLTLKLLSYLFLTGIFFVLVSFFWIYGAYFVEGTSLVSANYTTESWLKALSYATVTHTSLLQHVWWPPGQNIIAKPNYIFLFLPIVSFVALFTRRWFKVVLPLWLLALVGIFLSKGTNPPFSEINTWIFLNLPGFSAYRDPAKFFTIISFAYAVLFGLGAATLSSTLNRFKWKILKVVFPLLLLLLFAVGYQALWLQKIGRTFNKQPQIITKVNDWFTAQPDNNDWYRVFWWPTTYQYITFDGRHTPIIATGNNMMEITPRLPGIHQWIVDLKENPPFLSYLLNAYGVHYLAVPGDTVEKENYQHNYAFAQNQYIAKVDETGHFDQKNIVTDENGQTTHIWHNPNALERLFTSESIIITDTANSKALSKLASVNPLKNSLVFYDPQTATQDGIGSIFTRAQEVILNINYDDSRLDQGYLMWPLNVPATGSFRLLLPEDELGLTYTIDDQPLVKNDARIIGDQRYGVYLLSTLTVGQHQIKAILNTLNDDSALLTNFSNQNSSWTPCIIDDIGPISRLYEKSNNQYFNSPTSPRSTITSAVDETRCLQAKLSLSQERHFLLIDQDTETDNPQTKLYLNFIGIEDYNLPFSQMKGGYQLVRTTPRPFTKATLGIILPYSVQDTSIKINRLRLYDLGTVSSNQMILEPDPQPAVFTTDAFTIHDDSPVKKTVVIKHNPQGLVVTFSDEYHPGWQLMTADGKIVNDHFSTLLKQNAWFVPAGTEGSLTLIFSPVAKIKVAAYISLIGFLFLAALVIRRPSKKVIPN